MSDIESIRRGDIVLDEHGKKCKVLTIRRRADGMTRGIRVINHHKIRNVSRAEYEAGWSNYTLGGKVVVG